MLENLDLVSELRKYFPKYVGVIIDVVSFLSYQKNKKKFGDQTYF